MPSDSSSRVNFCGGTAIRCACMSLRSPDGLDPPLHVDAPDRERNARGHFSCMGIVVVRGVCNSLSLGPFDLQSRHHLHRCNAVACEISSRWCLCDYRRISVHTTRSHSRGSQSIPLAKAAGRTMVLKQEAKRKVNRSFDIEQRNNQCTRSKVVRVLG